MLKRLGVLGGALLGAGTFLGVAGATRLGIPLEKWPYVGPGLGAVREFVARVP